MKNSNFELTELFVKIWDFVFLKLKLFSAKAKKAYIIINRKWGNSIFSRITTNQVKQKLAKTSITFINTLFLPAYIQVA